MKIETESALKTHSRNELELMLAGKKPLAYFSRLVTDNFDEFEGQDFYKYVRLGFFKVTRFYNRCSINGNSIKIVSTLFYKYDEEWRAPIFKSLMTALHNDCKWTDEMEFMQGLLLGYSFEECMRHMEHYKAVKLL